MFNRLMRVGIKQGCFHSELLAWSVLNRAQLSIDEVECLGRMYIAFENERAHQQKVDKSKPADG